MLVEPAALEHYPAFYYPAGGNTASVRIDRVHLCFLRLYRLTRAAPLDQVPGERRNLKGILDALERNVARSRESNASLNGEDGGEQNVTV